MANTFIKKPINGKVSTRYNEKVLSTIQRFFSLLKMPSSFYSFLKKSIKT